MKPDHLRQPHPNCVISTEGGALAAARKPGFATDAVAKPGAFLRDLCVKVLLPQPQLSTRSRNHLQPPTPRSIQPSPMPYTSTVRRSAFSATPPAIQECRWPAGLDW